MIMYMVRHQAAGLMDQYAFAQRPSDAQVDVIKQLCSRLHGETHPKTGEAYWVCIEERELLGSAVLPELPPVPGLSFGGNEAAASLFSVTGEGTVSQG